MFNIDFEQLLFRIKIVSAILSFIFAILVIYFFYKFQKLLVKKVEDIKVNLRVANTPLSGTGQTKWEEILCHIDSVKESDWKLAIIEADNLVDGVLKAAGYLGETMGERMENIQKGQVQSLEDLWEAHKIRNKLVHDMNYFLRYAEAKRAINSYEAVLKEFNAI